MATKVTVRGNLDQALRKFKQKVARDGVPSEWKKREAYDKPGVRIRAAKKKESKILEKEIVLIVVEIIKSIHSDTFFISKGELLW